MLLKFKHKDKSKADFRYSTFYLIMLILATMNTIFIYPVFINIDYPIIKVNDLIFYSDLLSIILFIGAAASLVLLYMKNKIGLVLRTTVMVLGFIPELFLAFALEGRPIPQDFNMNNLIERIFEGQTGLYMDVLFSLLTGMSIAFLWILAWKSQLKYDDSMQKNKK
jgi:hypothetical protein